MFEQDIVANGMRLHFLDHGTPGPTPVVFLHGGGLTAHTWDGVCSALCTDHHCIALDLRGHGDSEWSPNLDYGLDAHLADLEAFLAHLAIPRCALVGQSLGGMVATRYASRHPQNMSALVVVDVAPFPREVSTLDHLMDFMLGRAVFATVDEAVERAVEFNPRRDRAGLRRSMGHSLRRLPDGRWTWKRDTRHLSREWFAERADEIARLGPEASSVACPTLIVRGSESDFSVEDAAAFAALVQDGTWTTVEGAGHNVQSDNPLGLADVLGPFLRTVKGRMALAEEVGFEPT